MSPEADGGHEPEGEARVLAELRRARRHRRVASLDRLDALYRAYVTFIVSGIVVWLVSGLVGDGRLGASSAAQVASRGPQIVGMVVGVALAVGVRSGGRGGPLAIEAADVRHVLMAPVDRTLALRGPALRQVRFSAAVAAAAGAVAGLLAYRRLPGDPAAWVVCGAAVAALAVCGGFGLALVASGRRIGARVGTLLALLILAWSGTDLAAHTSTSPATLLGEVAVWPLRFRAPGFAGVAVALVLLAVGFAVVGGTSIEAAERRASLVGQIRFAATLRDLRTVIVLRRQLAQELPRQRPWLRMPRTVAVGRSAHRRRLPAWRRGWHGILRFPALRFARMAVLGAGAGAAMVGVWRGTTPLLVVAALALYVAGLDAVEPVAQEIDHPDRADAYPEEPGRLHLRQTGPPLVLMLAVGLLGVGGAVAVSAGSSLALQVGLVTVVPAVCCATGAALISVILGAPPLVRATDSMMPPEIAGVRALLRVAVPPLVAVVGVLPVLEARHPPAHLDPAGAAASVCPEVLLVAAAVAGWVRYRHRALASWNAAMEEAKVSRSPRR